MLARNILEARQIFTETVQSFQKDGNQIGVVFSLEGMSSLYVKIDKPEVGARLISWTDATREKIGDSRRKLEQADMDKFIAGCIEQMGNTAFPGIYAEGKKMTLDDAIVYALQS